MKLINYKIAMNILLLKFYIAIEMVILLFMIFANAEMRASDSLFFVEIEKELRKNYQICNKDSSNVPLKQILHWEKYIDSITQSPEYSSIVRKFYTDNRNVSKAVLPCEIVQWYRDRLLSKQRADSLSLVKKNADNKRISDSLLFSADIAKAKKTPCDYKNIPFGISKKTFLFLTAKTGITPVIDNGDFILYEDSIDSAFKSIAFNFNKNGIYFGYEIESISLPLDSIDSHIHNYLDKISTYFQKKLNQNPQQNNKISKYEIVEGQLSVSKMWKTQYAEVYTGIATFGNQYYAKAIVNSF